MARRPEGWKLHQNKPGGAWIVRFTHAGRRHNISTLKRDLGEATTAAAKIYSNIVSGRWEGPDPLRTSGPEPQLDELASAWLESLETALDETTVDQYGLYVSGHWVPFFRSFRSLLATSEDAYWRHRLRYVRRRTVLKELSALRGFLRWCKEHGHASTVPLLSSPPRSATGTPDKRRPHKTRFLELTEEQIEAVLRELPEWHKTNRTPIPFPVRARFTFAWQTSLRPATLDAIVAPDDYRKGSATLLIRDEIDKARFGRDYPLTDGARAALDAVCPEVGLIFGRHDYRGLLREAARRAKLPGDLAERISPYDLRHSRLTHWAERSNNLAGIAYLAGHKNVTTTNRYIRPSERAARAVLEDAASPRLWSHTGHDSSEQESEPKTEEPRK